MTAERVDRRLAAVLAADVAGYSRLMGTNEEGTLARLKAVRKALVDPAIASHRGRIVKTTGDGMLVEFASAVDAVRSAIEVQRSMAEQNDALPQDQRIEFRIGIHVGDIIPDDNDIFGDGVNIAARLEGIAEAGSVCISDDAYRQVRGKVDMACDDLGPQNLKNIAEPMRAWRVKLSGQGAARAQSGSPASHTSGLALPDKPSIAVLPFQNMSGDPEQEYFADGMVEDIITALSRFKSLFVIARNSSFTYKGKAIDIKQVGRELGVRYVLEGSVRKAGGRVRITGQLIDASTGMHLWADRFEGSLEDVFDLQDRVTEQVIGAIAPEIDRAEIERANRRPIGSIDAVTEYYRGLPHVHRPTTPANNDLALRHFRNAIALDPNFSPAYGGAAICILWRRINFWPSDIPDDDAELLSFAERIKELSTNDAFTLDAVGIALFYNALNIDVGRDLNERAIRSNSNFAPGYHTRGWFQVWDGGSDLAIADFERSMRLSPRDPFAFSSMIGIAFAHYNASRYAEAAIWADKSIRAFPYFIGGLQIAVTCYVEAGRTEDAHRVMAEVLRLHPKWSFSGMMGYRGPIRSPEIRKKQWDSFRKAGLPE
ncbi:adenylate/guanylate cyclase domain-containing protein [Bradyrhizobium sp.]|uniref:adenylate/guanylate cyclase domain-containing protein n=1 Tax=Bradyrhizobium sp. TaxID=376 RepID=UPI003C70A4B0